MSYFNIVFHNIRSNPLICNPLDGSSPLAYYHTTFPASINVGSIVSPMGESHGMLASQYPPPSVVTNATMAGWGDNVSHLNGIAGIFLSESNIYTSQNLPRPLIHPGTGSRFDIGLAPPLSDPSGNKNCVFFEGTTPQNPACSLAPPDSTWFGGRSGIVCQGTGVLIRDSDGQHGAATSAPLPGSDRYGIRFQAYWNYPGASMFGIYGTKVMGLFVHIKNSEADTGTQIAAICRLFPDDIIFGDLNLNIREPRKKFSLESAIYGTHRLLYVAQQDINSTPYSTIGTDSALDYALIPKSRIANVCLFARRSGGAAAVLAKNGSDHSVMMLSIRCE